jgi:AraC family transcriptional regulator of adaptative response/methylated-DNA-[protein]-cysteine methyltransferase
LQRHFSERETILTSFSNDDDRWAAVVRRDQGAACTFYYSVLTTGVYCRPGCAARLPRRENVSFYPSCESAEKAGWRACKRCRPKEPPLAERRTDAISLACQLIETSEEMPNLDVLADSAGMSRFHFHRVFRLVTGMTPKVYAAARRPKVGCSARTSVCRSSSERESIRYGVGQSSLGAVLVACTDKGIFAIQFGDNPDGLVGQLRDRYFKAEVNGGSEDLDRLVAEVVGFIEAPRQGLDLPLDMRGTAFQQRVWQALREISMGSTCSYSDIARRIGVPKAVRAVSQACMSNMIAVAIPCHRIVRTDGALSNYRWGVQRKRALLERESSL